MILLAYVSSSLIGLIKQPDCVAFNVAELAFSTIEFAG